MLWGMCSIGICLFFSGFLPLHIFWFFPELSPSFDQNSSEITYFSGVFHRFSPPIPPRICRCRCCPDRARLYRTPGDLRRQTVRCSGHCSSAPQKDGFPIFSDPEILWKIGRMFFYRRKFDPVHGGDLGESKLGSPMYLDDCPLVNVYVTYDRKINSYVKLREGNMLILDHWLKLNG